MPLSKTYTKTILIPQNAIDENGHVNNVVFVQWMQNVATRHFEALGGEPLMHRDIYAMITHARDRGMQALLDAG
jgi:acyl-CoA thioester hydrolase